MARPAEPGRNALLSAGFEVAAARGLAGLSVNAVVDTAGMAKGSFYNHFPTRRDYLVALHRDYHERLNADVAEAIGDMAPGAARLRTGVEAFLDGCRRTRGTKALLAQSRTDADLLPEVSARNDDAAALMTPDMAELGWPDPGAVAVLTVAMIAETALIELYDDSERRDLRDTIMAMVTRLPS
ncbi:MAG TPA: helix-turn-helix domain-containing protein [Gordonia sp. (in: high G+C Gram-positive bacteria)]|uniref:TetR/AcrR family transcriptional regulator n=1 Tax=unclassified Gordonia (in: high G+C Gram-positive bacteria) TaxID=2657482 RepID=UPI000FBC7802|nr:MULTISPECIES: TetR/AcrR family transcriptional regulator [unclassified Gordonia (in: high G+C Gram-positive bacteria)]RUP36767.1 MAG: TetR/AcrR family transcriptional regulator [Gordonia sp. (in: high G+C Gram-positive bacteria)]HNP56959.1 helix-turn-helix domain-containing protein [Gordonia sp. (in: high G+C Gram-positive bacteria)]HRC50403.1 helix-turn-helix domain-containing protein [Gordonia sp. (in: high G+C Gram-positive bacteria)]